MQRISRRELAHAPWTYTDDTEMALSIVEVLKERGSIDQDLLAKRFAKRMQFNRGYGQGAYAVLRRSLGKHETPKEHWEQSGSRRYEMPHRAAIRATPSALGDRDTTCAIVGGILALRSGRDGIPRQWLQARETLPIGPDVSAT
jgi:ADP-ribosylglycohydrolase